MSAGPVFVIEPTRGWRGFGLAELWAYRELLYFLTWRDVTVRYKQTLLGVAWAILQPGLTMVVFTIFFGRLAKVPSDGIPYPVFAYCGLLPWQLFATSVAQAGNSLVSNQGLITKIYFPRLIFPLSACLAAVVDFAAASLLLAVLMAWYRIVPGPSIVLLPAFLLLALATALGIGLWLSALNVQFRDVRYTIPFMLQLLLLATPIAYPSSLVPSRWAVVLGFNPMAGVVSGFRWALLDGDRPAAGLLIASTATAVLLVVTGLMWFRRMERTFADTV